MKKMKLKKLAIPLLISSMACVAQANDHSHKSHGHSHHSHGHHKSHGHHDSKAFDFYGFNQSELYVGASLEMSNLKDAELNQDAKDKDVTKLRSDLAGLVTSDAIIYKQTGVGVGDVNLITNSDIPSTATAAKATAADAAAVLSDAVSQGLLVKDSTPKYTLPAEAYKQQFDAKYKKDDAVTTLTNHGFSFDEKNVTGFSALLGAKVLNEHQFLIGLEAQATYFKEKFESLENIHSFSKGENYSDGPKAANIYLTNISDQATKVSLPKTTAQVAFDTPTTLSHTFTGTEHIYATVEFKRKFAVTGDVSFGKRFDLNKGMSLDAFAILGYGYTTFEVNNNDNKKDDKGNAVSPVLYGFNNSMKTAVSATEADIKTKVATVAVLKSVTKVEIKDKSATGLRFGAGATLNIDQQYAFSFKVVQAKLKGYTLLDDKLKSLDMSLSFQYKF